MISELWNGRGALADNCGTQTTEMKQLINLLERNRESLFKNMTEQQKELFEKYIDCQEEYLFLLTESAFCRGFCYASKLWGEAVFSDM